MEGQSTTAVEGLLSSTILSPQSDYQHAESCNICNEKLGLPRLDGQIENATMLPCSHIFGSRCITRWLESDSLHQDCPNCRRRMVYRECGHIIKPCDVSRAPKSVNEKDMPEKCLICRGGGVLEEQLRRMQERQLVEQRALEGMKLRLPVIFGGMCRGTVDSVDARVERSKDLCRREMEDLCAELQEQGRDDW
jgi:hypothetical protein